MEQKIKFSRSQKVYLPGKLYPNIRVAMRKVEQVPVSARRRRKDSYSESGSIRI